MPCAQPSISIALATFNGARFLPAQIASLLAQSRMPSEIVVSDDRSTDDTVQVLQRIAATTTVPIVVSVNETRLGYRANFMRAASLTSGELISFCDQDDFWHANKLETVAKAFEDRGVLLAFHNAELADDSGRRLGRYVHQTSIPSRVFGRLGMNPWNSPLGFTQTFHRSLLRFSEWRRTTEDPFVPTEPLAHDQWLPLLAGAFGKMAYIEQSLVDYRQHQNNVFGISLAEKKKISRLAEKALRNMDYDRLARVSRKIALMFAAIADGSTPDVVAKASDARQRYEELAELYARRHQIYTGRQLLLRAREWRTLANQGVYGGRQSIAFVQKALARDFVGGVLLRGGLEKTAAGRLYRTDYDGSLQFQPFE